MIEVNNYLLAFGKKEVLYISSDEDNHIIRKYGLKKCRSLAIRLLGLPDLLINPKSREVMGIVYSDFTVLPDLITQIERLESSSIRLFNGVQSNSLNRYREFPAESRLEVCWGKHWGMRIGALIYHGR